MVDTYVKVSSTWQQVKEAHVRVSGSWTPVKTGWARVSGVWQQIYSRRVAILGTTITVGQLFDDLGYFAATYGSIVADTFMDLTSTNRQIAVCDWNAVSNRVRFFINASGVPNNDQTFYGIAINGQTEILRSAASFVDNAGLSQWTWSLAPTGYGTAGNNVALTVRCGY